MRLIDADRLLSDRMKSKYYHLPNGDIAIPIIDIEHAPTVATDINVPGKWISVEDRMPVETHSIFFPWYGKPKWSNAMWREQSDKVLVAIAFKDGTRMVTTGETHDGIWHTTVSRTLDPVVTHWMPLPEPPKEGEK